MILAEPVEYVDVTKQMNDIVYRYEVVPRCI